MKTLEGWNNSGVRTLEEYVFPGDEVDLAMVEYFRDIMPPLIHWENLLQVGEPYSIAKDEEGHYHSTWTTFYRRHSDQWFYAGHCFKGESINRKDDV